MQRSSRRFLQHRRISVRQTIRPSIRLLQDVGDALVRRSEAFGLGKRLESFHRFELLRHDARAGPDLAEHRIDLQRRETLFLR
jgi:hypothetical protein